MPQPIPDRLTGEGAVAPSRRDPTRALFGELRRRIGTVALLGAVTYTIFIALLASPFAGDERPSHAIEIVHDLIGLTLSALVWIASRWSAVPDRALHAIVLIAEVLLALVISIATPWATFLQSGAVPPITWAVPLIILVPLVVPAKLKHILVASIASAFAMPLALLWLWQFQGVALKAADLYMSIATGVVAVLIAWTAAGTLNDRLEAGRVGPYRLKKIIGRGGMGEVWQAEHLLLARPAALKQILPDALRMPREDRGRIIERFWREARITASLCSPHTVQLFDFGTTSEGTLYYVMELLEGETMQNFVGRYGPVEPRRVVAWLQQACDSLAEAHAANLVHRDIKPSNLFVCRQGRDRDFVKVLDFGLTRAVAIDTEGFDPATLDTPGRLLHAAAQGPGLTRMGAVPGTPSYMAPEQIRGESEPRSDLYALGCVAFFLLTGRQPFVSDKTVEVLRMHRTWPAEPPSRHATQEIGAALDRLVLSCMAKEPGERPASADVLYARLGECVERPWTQADSAAWYANLATAKAATAAPVH